MPTRRGDQRPKSARCSRSYFWEMRGPLVFTGLLILAFELLIGLCLPKREEYGS